jgi:hypothetical protein
MDNRHFRPRRNHLLPKLTKSPCFFNDFAQVQPGARRIRGDDASNT